MNMRNIDNYSENRKYGDLVINHAIEILYEALELENRSIRDGVHWYIEVANVQLDTTMATDLIVVNNEGGSAEHIGLRTRDLSEYINRFPFDFTVRFSCGSGGDTEYQKVLEHGYCDYLFYCFSDTGGYFSRWAIIDYTIFREEHFFEPVDAKLFGKDQWLPQTYLQTGSYLNSDNKTGLMAYYAPSFRGKIIKWHSPGYYKDGMRLRDSARDYPLYDRKLKPEIDRIDK